MRSKTGRRVRLTKRIAEESRRNGCGREARQYSGFYELSSGSPAVWVMIGGNEEKETQHAIKGYLGEAERYAINLLKKAGLSPRGWLRRDVITATGGKVSGLVHLVGEPMMGMSIMEALRESGLREGRP